MGIKEGSTIRGLKVHSILGKGSFATVYEVEGKNNQKFAMKVIKKSKLSNEKMIQQFNLECTVMEEIKHPNVLHIFDKFDTNKKHILLLELCQEDMKDYPIRRKQFTKRCVPEPLALLFFMQMVNGVSHLHTQGYIHRDLKLENIFLTKDMKVIVGDLGEAFKGAESGSIAGSQFISAPEALRAFDTNDSNVVYNHKMDIWSLGCCLYALLFYKNKYMARDNAETLKLILADSGQNLVFDEAPNPISEEVKDLLRCMLEPDPNMRINWQGIFNHPVFNNRIRLEDLEKYEIPKKTAIATWGCFDLNKKFKDENIHIKSDEELKMEAENIMKNLFNNMGDLLKKLGEDDGDDEDEEEDEDNEENEDYLKKLENFHNNDWDNFFEENPEFSNDFMRMIN